jgi:hypothetical protein
VSSPATATRAKVKKKTRLALELFKANSARVTKLMATIGDKTLLMSSRALL